jgi:hypothetical protein
MLSHWAGGAAMFDVYLNRKGDLLVLPNGLPIPKQEAGGWRKKKTKVAAVSDEIRFAIQRRGYYRRKLGEPVSTTTRSQHEVKCDLETASALAY